MKTLSTMVTKMRFHYYTNMIDLNNALNQLKLRSDDRAEEIAKRYFYEILDCFKRMGYKVDDYFED